ncbi:hypothetical protein A2U01_0101931, partial [Trifolium medium]|nr:hypothetical protein [Trifolium medium]
MKGAARSDSGQVKETTLVHKKRKGGGGLRLASLKKVARLPCKDRRE